MVLPRLLNTLDRIAEDPRRYGAAMDGITNDQAAVGLAQAAAISRGVELLISGPCLIDGLTISSPLEIRFSGGGALLASASSTALFAVSANLTLTGASVSDTRLEPKAGTPCFLFSDWPLVEEWDHSFRLSNLRISGGSRHVDMSALASFNAGIVRCENCVFDGATDKSFALPHATYYPFWSRCQWSTCVFGELDDNCEGRFHDCIFSAPASGATSVTLTGAHHTRFLRCDFYGYAGATAPDVLIVPDNDGASGFTYFEECRFASEREVSLASARRRVVIANGADPDYPTARLVMRDCEFLRPAGFAISSIGKTGGTATATLTTGWDSIGHQLEVGDGLVVMSVTGAGEEFNGYQTVTSKTTTTVSWAASAGTIAQAALGGYIGSCETAAIGLDNPASGLLIDGCEFQNYAYGIDDKAVETQNAHGQSGRRRWLNCTGFGPFGMFWRETTSGGFRGGIQFEPRPDSPRQAFGARPPREHLGLRNRLKYSEDFTQWGSVGVTVTAGQTDPEGGTTAWLIERDGADQIVEDNGTGWALNEGITAQSGIDLTDIPTNVFLRVWAKAAGGADRAVLWVMTYDGDGRTHSQYSVSVDDTWREFVLPLTVGPSIGGGVLALVLSAGGVYPESASVVVWRPCIDDYGGDYYPSAASYGGSSAGSRFSRRAEFADGVSIGTAAVRSGAGSPEGVVTGNVGDVFYRTDGGSGTALYVKESGTGNTGWAAVATGAGGITWPQAMALGLGF